MGDEERGVICYLTLALKIVLLSIQHWVDCH